MVLPVLQLADPVVFPGMTLSLGFGSRLHKRLLQQVLAQDEHRFVITNGNVAQPGFGTCMALLAVEGNGLDGFAVTAHGMGRQRLDIARTEQVVLETGRVEQLTYVYDVPAPLGRDDPGRELLEAWDTEMVFRRYASTFLDRRLQEQIDEAIPNDPFYLASFICANSGLGTVRQQAQLAASTLVDRLRLVRSQMNDLLRHA